MEWVKEYKWEILAAVLLIGLYFVYPSFDTSKLGLIFSECFGTFVIMFIYGVTNKHDDIQWYTVGAVFLLHFISLFIVLSGAAFIITIICTVLGFGGLFLGIAIGKNGVI